MLRKIEKKDKKDLEEMILREFSGDRSLIPSSFGFERIGFFVEEEGDRQGFVFGTACCGDAELELISVREDLRRKGLATKLLCAFLEESRIRGCRLAFLEVRASNEGAIRFYEKQGFTEVGRRREYYRKPTEDAVLMRKEFYD